jgi:hypothetical protein
MKFLPFDSIIYKTKLKEEEVKKRLANNVAATKYMGLVISNVDYDKPYRGTIDGNSFAIRRRIQYRNSFVPTLHGLIESDYVDTIIRIKMRLRIFVMLFLIFWCSVVGFAAFAVLALGVSRHFFDPVGLIPFGMLLGAYLMTIIGFNKEKKIAIKDWQGIFEAEIVN